jgi:hypothetical protein
MNAQAKIQLPTVKYEAVQLGGGSTSMGQTWAGGLDLTTPSLRLQSGVLVDALNFECAQSGGYARCTGYERVDGQFAPSDATYTIIQIAGFENTPALGDVVTQAVSGATGTVIAVVSTDSTNWDASFWDNFVWDSNLSYVVVTRVTGIFDETHDLTTSGPAVAGNVTLEDGSGDWLWENGDTIAWDDTTSGSVLIGTATELTVFLDAQTKAIYKALAADVYRALIGAVPGSGKILGVLAMNLPAVLEGNLQMEDGSGDWLWENGDTIAWDGVTTDFFGRADSLFAFRADVGNTAVAIYRTSDTGWTLVPLYNIVSFTAGGTAVPLDGDTLTQGGVTATIKRVVWQSGAWTGTAVGQFVITNPAGGNFTAGAAHTTSTATVTLSGVQTAITLAPGGRFEFVKTNFSGDISTRRAYGCDGVNKAFEFDGDTLVPISTGLSPDVPSHITAHKNYLIVSQGSSILGSGPGLPFKWLATDGAWEIATGDVVNAMQTLPGDQSTATLAVLLRSNTAILYGTDRTTFNFVTLNTGVGALPYTVQNLFDVCMLDTLGIVTLRATLSFGNFSSNTLTKNILPFIQRERSKVTASITSHEKSQYRLFFNDGFALYCTVVNQQYLGAIPQQFPNPVNVTDDTNLIDGSEAIYFGSTDDNGYVYQMEKGTSFDGHDISAYFVTSWDPIKSPRVLKRFRAASIEVQGEGYAAIQYGYNIAYADRFVQQPLAVSATLNLSQRAYWDSFTWDEFVWDGFQLMPTDVSAVGTAENIQVAISSATNYMTAYTIDSIIHHYTPRRGMRV